MAGNSVHGDPGQERLMLCFITWDEVDQVSLTRTRVTGTGNLVVVWGGITVGKLRGARLSGKGSKAGK